MENEAIENEVFKAPQIDAVIEYFPNYPVKTERKAKELAERQNDAILRVLASTNAHLATPNSGWMPIGPIAQAGNLIIQGLYRFVDMEVVDSGEEEE